MKYAIGRKIREIIHHVELCDRVNSGVAKARFAGKATYSVPSLERLMRGEKASDDQIKGTLEAATFWGLSLTEDDLFSGAATSERAS